MTEKQFNQIVRRIANSNARIVVKDGSARPEEKGRGFIKLSGRAKNGYFLCTYYPSTRRIEVGRDFLTAPYNNDNH